MPTYDSPTTLYDGPNTYDSATISLFTPPTDDIVGPVYVGPGLGPQNDPYYPIDPLMHQLMRHYRRQTRGRNIFLMSDGTVLDSQINGTPPNMIQPPTDPYATVYDSTQGINASEPQITQFFQVPYVKRTLYGGSDNPVNAAEIAQLQAAGYGAYLH